MQTITDYLPWFSLLTIFGGMGLLQWRIIGALDKALERQQGGSNVVLASDKGLPGPQHATDESKPPPQVSTAPALDETLVAFVKKQEGFSAKAYGDFKQYSIGYGTKATSPHDIITEAEADQRLRVELAEAEKFVVSFIPNAPKGVQQAMTDATYNLGTGWSKQELGALLVNQQYDEAKSHLKEYIHAGGKVNQDLVNRRALECNMFDHPL